MPKSKSPEFYPRSRSKPTTRNEDKTKHGIFYNHIYKSSKGRSHIYEQWTKDKSFSSLKLTGPSDSYINLDSNGNLKLITGIKSKSRGPGSGKLAIKSWGQQQLHNERSDIQYNCSDDPDNVALAVLAYGDTIEENRGSERTIRANRIVIKADSELVLQGSNIIIQSGESGKGKISIKGSLLDQDLNTFVSKVKGETRFNYKEVNFYSVNPRSSFNITTAGNLNSIIGGDVNETIRGSEVKSILGRKTRFSANPVSNPGYHLTVVRGEFNMNILRKTAKLNCRVMELNSSRNVKFNVKRNMEIETNGNLKMKGSRNIEISSNRNVDIKSTNRIGIVSNNRMRLQGSSIFLN